MVMEKALQHFFVQCAEAKHLCPFYDAKTRPTALAIQRAYDELLSDPPQDVNDES